MTLTAFAKPQVTTSILPTKYFIEQIAGDTIDVNVMVQKGADAHTYEPKPKQMSELEKSKLYFAIGIEFEDVWLKKFTQNYPNLIVVNTQEGIEKIPMAAHNHASHEHGDHEHDADHEKHEHGEHEHDADHEKHEHGEHEHDADHEKHEHGEHACNCDHHDHEHKFNTLDPHIWLDPVLVKVQATNIANALITTFPENKDLYTQNLKTFLTKLDALDAFIADSFKDKKDKKFIVHHPSWGYFAKRYGLTQLAIEVAGKEP
ncbi:MAG: zinc ABC transporter substrate-binding protein, partial [Campylobacter sp.]|nr:zinc ABC transporter substrate-binding protein [Campylobacter sp.]